MTQSPTGGPAQTIHQVTSRQGIIGRDAQRVVIVTDGRPAEGGPQQAAYFVTDAEIAAGDFIVTGNKPLPIVTVGAAGAEYPPIAVYDVTGKPDDVQPAQYNVNVEPLLDLEADTGIAVNTTPYAGTGTITQSGTTVTGSGEAIFPLEIVIGDRINAPGIDGIVKSITGLNLIELDSSATVGTPISFSITPQSGTARVETWADQSGNGHDFTQSGLARPVRRYSDGIPYIVFAQTMKQWMLGEDFADNLSSFSMFIVYRTSGSPSNGNVVTKMNSDTGRGWSQASDGIAAFSLGEDFSNYFECDFNGIGSLSNDTWYIYSVDKVSNSEIHQHYNSSVPDDSTGGSGILTTFSNSEPVRIGTADGLYDFALMDLHAIRIYSPCLSDNDRAAIEEELAARYGITL